MRERLSFIHGASIIGTVLTLMGQPALANTALITAVQINSTDQGIDVVLESSSSQPLQTFSTSYGNVFVVDVTNARLELADGSSFQQNNPAEGILSVAVETLDANSIRITVVGDAEAPQIQIAQLAQELMLNVSTPTAAIAEQPDSELELADEMAPVSSTPDQAPASEANVETEEDGTIRILVTGEEAEEGYRVPNTTTGTRTDTPILDVPQAVQVIPREVLEDQAATDLQDALRNVSGVSQGNTSGNVEDEFAIRGFSRVTILQDGFRSIEGNLRETANLERIEVLQGPASVLYGSGQPGGVINLVTKQPLPEPYYAFQMQVGSDSFFRPQLDLSGPLTDDGNVLYRLNAAVENAEGFRNFDQDIERFFVAPVVSFAFGDRTNLTLEFDYLQDERPFDRGLVAFGEGVADIPLDRILGEPDDFFENEEYRARYRLEHRFSDRWTLRNAFQYASSDSLNVRAEPDELDESTGDLSRFFNSNDIYEQTYAVQTEVEGKVNTGSIAHTLLFGIDFSNESGETITRSTFAPSINIFDPVYEAVPRPDLSEFFTTLNQEVERTRWGFYLQDQIDFTDELILVLGGRFDVIGQSLDQTSLFVGDANSSGQETAFSPRVGLVYQPIEAVSLYANFSRSFQPNTFFSITADGEFVDFERGTQYEIGVKADWLDGRLSSTLALFNTTRTNIAAPDPDAPPGSGFVIPIGEERSRGIGLDIAGEVLPGWNIIASYSYIDAEITESNELGVPEGNRPTNVPRNSANLWTTYEIQAGALEGLGLGLGLLYVGDREGDPANTFELPSYFRTDAAVFYKRDNWRAALNIQNLFDINYFENSGNTRLRVNPGEPLTIIGTLAVEL